MFVRKNYPGKGISKQILSKKEEWVRLLNLREPVLETGNKQAEAIGFYEKYGFTRTQNYGPYIGGENSICIIK